MQEQSTIQSEPSGVQTQAATDQLPGRRRQHHTRRLIFGSLVMLGLVVASIAGIQLFGEEQSVSETRQLSPAIPAGEDPPLPEGWVDPYFTNSPAVVPAVEDPPLPEGWVDPYFNRSVAIPRQEDPPLPEGWVDPYFQETD